MNYNYLKLNDTWSCKGENYTNVESKNSEAIYYINLDHRTDRRREVEEEFRRMGITGYHRFPAIYNKSMGALGCSSSHIRSLQNAMETGAEHLIIFEDDIQFLVSPEEYSELIEALKKIDYDVFVFTHSYGQIQPSDHPLLRRITTCYSSTGYVVSRKYAPTLLENFRDGWYNMSIGKEDSTLDVYWISLQKKDKWFCYYKKMAQQRPGYSDISKVSISHHKGFD